MAKVAFMLLPLGTLLAFIGSDQRHKPDMRARALKLLKKLDSKFALAIGLSADWGIVTQAFLRLFDKTSHDIAKTHAEIAAFKTVLRVLFEEGSVFYRRDFPGIDGQPAAATRASSSLPAIGGYLGSEGVRPAFVTQSVEKTISRKVVFNCGNEQVVLWGPPKAEDVKDMALRLKFVTAQVIDRVDAEFGHLSAFRCFDVVEVSRPSTVQSQRRHRVCSRAC